jgi:hypothetical protein
MTWNGPTKRCHGLKAIFRKFYFDNLSVILSVIATRHMKHEYGGRRKLRVSRIKSQKSKILGLSAKHRQHATEHLSELTIDLKHRILLC